jgi:hypothetical protein
LSGGRLDSPNQSVPILFSCQSAAKEKVFPEVSFCGFSMESKANGRNMKGSLRRRFKRKPRGNYGA